MQFSKNVTSLVPSATLAIRARAKRLQAEGHSIIDLSAGEPSFLTPAMGIEAGVAHVGSGKAGYPPTAGTPELRSAVAAYVGETTRHARVEPGSVLVSNGVKQALFNIAFCLFQEGDEVLIPAPYWPSYLAIVELSGARPIIVPTAWQNRFRLEVSDLESARSPATRALFINSPANPTGEVYDLGLMNEILAWAATHGIWVLSDEIYRRLYYEGGSAPSVFDADNLHEKVVHLDGLSKAFSMPGWRIGYAVGPEELIAKASALQSQTTSGAAGPSQAVAAAVLAAPRREEVVEGFRGILDRRRRTAVQALRGVSALDTALPAGAIYVYPRLKETSDSKAVAESLLTEAGVACIPGEAFGTPGFLRLNHSVSDDELSEGLTRIVEFFT